jgi:hypothetical protein
MLVNPTGKPGKLRAVDWVVEGNNCEIKVTYGGHGSNQTIKRMITESALVGTYRAIGEKWRTTCSYTQHQRMVSQICGKHLPNFGKAFGDCSPHVFIPGRKSIYCIPDMLNKGAELLHNKSIGDEDEDGELRLSLDDIILELC